MLGYEPPQRVGVHANCLTDIPARLGYASAFLHFLHHQHDAAFLE